MAQRIVQISKPAEITTDDLHDAYLLCKLRRLGIGFAKAMETPSILIALRGTAAILKRKKQSSSTAPVQLPLIA